MYFGFKGELVRNSTAYFLVIVGVPLVILGSFKRQDEITKCGAGFIAAAMLAFKAKPDQQS